MKRNQTFHERLIPMLVEGMGAQSYLELGTYRNDTISKVKCNNRYGVDISPMLMEGVEFFEMDTTKFIKELAAQYAPFDVVFVDADHSSLAVMKDFVGIWPYVSTDGLVLLHDSNPETRQDTDPGFCGDAWRAVEMITRVQEAVTLPYHPGLTIIRKRTSWGPA